MDKKIIVLTDNYELLLSFKEILIENELNVSMFDFFSTEIDNKDLDRIDINLNQELILEKYKLLISLHCRKIIPSKIYQNIKCINIHPGLNPYNRGWYPQVFCILNKSPYGATIHEINEFIDGGDIIDNIETKIESHFTSKEAYELNRINELSLIRKNITNIINEKYVTKKLQIKGNYNSRKDLEVLNQIDLNKKVTMREALDYLRAVSFSGFDNAFFIDEDNKRVYVEIKLKKYEDCISR